MLQLRVLVVRPAESHLVPLATLCRLTATAGCPGVTNGVDEGCTLQSAFKPARSHAARRRHPSEPWMQEFIGSSPTFEAVDGSGIVVGSKLISGSGLAPRSGGGGFGSVGDVLLGSTSSRGTFSWPLHETQCSWQCACS